jgi:DNA-binding GntR family transcriptional regulator
MNEAPLTSPKDYVTRFVLDRYDQPSKVSEIAGIIGLEIIEGERPPGSQLDSVSLAAHFETSRTPVREALMVLEKEGLVEMPPRKRPFVSRPDLVEIRENYEIRAALMGIVMARVAERGSDQELRDLRLLFARMQSAAKEDDPDAYFWANVAFHERATLISSNSLLGRILGSLYLRALRYRRLGLSLPGRRERSVEDHARLMRALEERDIDLATALMRSIINTALFAVEHHKARLF